jgi:DNA-directed RNA polymerase subunit delta
MRDLTLPAKFTKKRYAWLISWAAANGEISPRSGRFPRSPPGKNPAFQRRGCWIERKQGSLHLLFSPSPLFEGIAMLGGASLVSLTPDSPGESPWWLPDGFQPADAPLQSAKAKPDDGDEGGLEEDDDEEGDDEADDDEADDDEFEDEEFDDEEFDDEDFDDEDFDDEDFDDEDFDDEEDEDLGDEELDEDGDDEDDEDEEEEEEEAPHED